MMMMNSFVRIRMKVLEVGDEELWLFPSVLFLISLVDP